MPMPRMKAPMVAIKLGEFHPMFPSYTAVRRGMPLSPRKCIGKKVTLKPTKMTQKESLPQNSETLRPKMSGNQ